MTVEQLECFVRGGLDVLAVNPGLSPRDAVERWASEQGLRRAFWATCAAPDRRWITKEVKRRMGMKEGEDA